MDAKYFRDKAETYSHLAMELRWNNPGRFHLMDIAEKTRGELPISKRKGSARLRKLPLSLPGPRNNGNRLGPNESENKQARRHGARLV